MDENEQLHMTVVVQKRRRLDEEASAAPEAARQAGDPASHPRAHSSSGGSHHSGQGSSGSSHHSGHGSSGSSRHSGHGSSGGSRHADQSGHRHRYHDYGTVDLGSLEAPRDTPAAPGADAPEPSQGQLQREFYDKYDTVLNRRYRTRDGGKTARIIMLALLTAVLVLAALTVIIGLRNQLQEPITAPSVETLPVQTLDLG